MELRQLRYFVAVARELHFGRAAERSHISGSALSQQIQALERELGAELFTRDRRTVRLTEAGRVLLEDARQILALAEGAAHRVRDRAAETTPLRLGYVSWLPDEVEALAGPAAGLRPDGWVLPSHTQADRVADGSLDLALAWVTRSHAEARGLAAHLLRVQPLAALAPASTPAGPVPAAGLSVLVDLDEHAWSSWNRFAEEFAGHTGAAVVRIEDGGIVGEAFHNHVRRLNAPVLASPKRHPAPTPPSLAHRPVAAPVPLWTWSLLHRAGDDRASVRHAVDSLLAFARGRGWTAPPAPRWWVPSDDPHRTVLTGPGG
ncbi:LysR family transcriptional regulator [Amycolatopsis sp. PS_44_ISF1]|uniref:LysR family transcriptional regulator n=1 Tax=Amycolatopsis sp. PS_44_ISF1 TaxID=2974917 RepID=UPI0028DEE370|nr:LysR family transcriptional regulator [Amycolatopsis sp. PS_44_ISF1]MDT8913118.1 LysR family transcriptional regulator [Amycolatopsis sp. PS_44_ISF1]